MAPTEAQPQQESSNIVKKTHVKKAEKMASKHVIGSMPLSSLAPSSSKRSRFGPIDEVEADSKPTARTKKKPRPRTTSESSIDSTKPLASPSILDPKSSPTVDAKNANTKAFVSTTALSGPAEDDKAVLESSAPNTRPHRSESQRIQFLKDHPNCGEFEPRRAFCTRCERWVALSGSQSYPLTRWNRHVEKCVESPTKLEVSPTKEESDHVENDSEEDRMSVAPSIPGQVLKRARNESERYAYLQADPRVLEIKDHEVQCKACQRWIKLGNDRKYMLTRWERHKVRCSGGLPDGRVATANRRLQLVNDSQARHYTPTSVECIACDDTIALEGEGDYNLAKWHDHKTRCPKLSSRSAPSKSTQSSPARQARTPASAASTDTTAVASEGSPLTSKRVKRRRDVEEGDDNIRHVRARMETYNPPPGNLPGIWDWVTYPFKAFMRGFKEGLGTGSSSGA